MVARTVVKDNRVRIETVISTDKQRAGLLRTRDPDLDSGSMPETARAPIQPTPNLPPASTHRATPSSEPARLPSWACRRVASAEEPTGPYAPQHLQADMVRRADLIWRPLHEGEGRGEGGTSPDRPLRPFDKLRMAVCSDIPGWQTGPTHQSGGRVRLHASARRPSHPCGPSTLVGKST